jgi:queuine tRNA-ribosyltransferase
MFSIVKKDANSRARLGRLETPHGTVETPAYVIVGTNAEVRTLAPEDLPETKTQMIIANTYHLWRQLGDEGLESYPGLHAEMDFKGVIMTDSGGFQVFSLGFLREHSMRRSDDNQPLAADPEKNLVRITNAGVYFHPSESVTGEELYLDAETSVKIQEQLGADIIVAFDEPTAPAQDHEYTKTAMERTHRWAERSLEAKESKDQLMYGVVQGGAFEDLRSESAKFIGSLPFDGFAIGSTYGDAYGGTKDATRDMLRWSIPHLPENKPRHLFGVGRIEDLLFGIEEGIDTFDCVIPTREARHGRLWTARGHIDVKKASFRDDKDPIDETCGCPACLGEGAVTKGELRQMFKDKDPKAGRLATLHNVYFFNDFMEKVRDALRDGTFADFKKEALAALKKAD